MISLYRPAGPETELAGNLARCRLPVIGASPSGKAVDFDSTIRRFESSRPSQALSQLKTVYTYIAKGPEKSLAFPYYEMSRRFGHKEVQYGGNIYPSRS